jgi:hypothetical protein
MNIEIGKRWVEALRNGEYKQGHHCLMSGYKFCCLGVLCDLYRKENGGEWKPDHDLDYYSFERETFILPVKVKEWAGMRTTMGERAKENVPSLAIMNDNERSFLYIADVIENEMETL